jgi:hypothetical protein
MDIFLFRGACELTPLAGDDALIPEITHKEPCGGNRLRPFLFCGEDFII